MSAAVGVDAAVFDRSLYEDSIYARIAHEAGHTTADEFGVFVELQSVLTASLPRPSLLIYLFASTECIQERMRQRARSFEEGLTRRDLELLQLRYREWIERYQLSPVMRLDAERLSLAER